MIAGKAAHYTLLAALPMALHGFGAVWPAMATYIATQVSIGDLPAGPLLCALACRFTLVAVLCHPRRGQRWQYSDVSILTGGGMRAGTMRHLRGAQMVERCHAQGVVLAATFAVSHNVEEAKPLAAGNPATASLSEDYTTRDWGVQQVRRGVSCCLAMQVSWQIDCTHDRVDSLFYISRTVDNDGDTASLRSRSKLRAGTTPSHEVVVTLRNQAAPRLRQQVRCCCNVGHP